MENARMRQNNNKRDMEHAARARRRARLGGAGNVLSSIESEFMTKL